MAKRALTLALCCMAMVLLAAAPASAQFFYETPKKPVVEIDLSVLDAASPVDTPAIAMESQNSVAVERTPLTPPDTATPKATPVVVE